MQKLDIKKLLAKMLTAKTYSYTDFTYNTGWTAYATSGMHAPKACKNGKLVNISGLYKATSDRTDSQTIGKVPAGCEPLQTQQFLGLAWYNRATCRLTIYEDGNIVMDLFGAQAQNIVPIPKDTWVSIATTYIAKH